jgi:hypothetical protein
MKRDDSTGPGIEHLLTTFLNRQAEDRAVGLPELPVGEVEPYEAAFAPMVEPRVAFDEAVAALQLLDIAPDRSSMNPPPDWSALVTGAGSLAALAFAAGNFPQLVRDLPALVRSEQRSDLLKKVSARTEVPALARWTVDAAAKGYYPQCLFGVGALRVVENFDVARKLLADLRVSVPARWLTALENEEAALLWHSGKHAQALADWNALAESPLVNFNRGMAYLFLDRPVEARDYLRNAVTGMAEDNAWYHLARLYLAFAEM